MRAGEGRIRRRAVFASKSRSPEASIVNLYKIKVYNRGFSCYDGFDREVNRVKTKEHLLALFEKNKGTYFSGEEIAAALSVSRAAVWKAVQSLRSEGYEIDAVPNKGYSLSSQTDILSAQGIRKYLEPPARAWS